MNPFEDDIGIAKLEKRLGVLLRQFKTLAPGMTDLPLYSHNVGIEAVDFMPFGDVGFGALVTPWFINAVFLPLEPVSYNPDQVGKTGTVHHVRKHDRRHALAAQSKRAFLGRLD